MKNQHLTGLLLALLLTAAAGIASCSDPNKRDFFYPRIGDAGKDTYEIPVERGDDISIVSGNGNYIFKIEDENIIGVSHITVYNQPFGVLRIDGKRKGTTLLSVTDPRAQVTIDLHIKVIDNYLTFLIVESDDPALKAERFVYLVKNTARDAYFFEKDERDHPGTLLAKGTYEFTVENASPCLTLSYPEKDRELTGEPVAYVSRKFDISDSAPVSFKLLESYSYLIWKPSFRHTKTSPPQLPYMKMKEKNGNTTISGFFANSYRIPDNILE